MRFCAGFNISGGGDAPEMSSVLKDSTRLDMVCEINTLDLWPLLGDEGDGRPVTPTWCSANSAPLFFARDGEVAPASEMTASATSDTLSGPPLQRRRFISSRRSANREWSVGVAAPLIGRLSDVLLLSRPSGLQDGVETLDACWTLLVGIFPVLSVA